MTQSGNHYVRLPAFIYFLQRKKGSFITDAVHEHIDALKLIYAEDESLSEGSKVLVSYYTLVDMIDTILVVQSATIGPEFSKQFKAVPFLRDVNVAPDKPPIRPKPNLTIVKSD